MELTQTLQEKVLNLPELPGIYRMVDQSATILYIGKAKNLRKRVSNYLQAGLSSRILRMMSQVRTIDYTVTASEAEAFLLEASLIKKHKPRYNILLKDDKSFPYLKLSKHTYPQIAKFRGKNRTKEDNLFGPYPSSSQLDAAITELQKLFLLRSCSDTYFATRKRPCLLYQIKRCSAPCVGKVSEEEYTSLVKQAKLFLKGKISSILDDLRKQMLECSKKMEYESAAGLRDRIKSVEYIRSNNAAYSHAIGDADVIAIGCQEDNCGIQVFVYRSGQNLGNNSYYPSNLQATNLPEALQSFIGQFYQNKVPPPKVLVNEAIEDNLPLQQAFFDLHGVKSKITLPSSKSEKLAVQMAEQNLQLALENKNRQLATTKGILERIKEIFELPDLPHRIEVYDNSHIMGQYAVGAMIVASPEGLEKQEYRKFNIRTNLSAFGGDDYQMLREVLTRRLAKLSPENTPDLMIIDGGKGHMGVVAEVLDYLNLDLKFVCMSKGPERNKGGETFHTIFRDGFTLPNDDPVMRYLQHLRNQAHDFAISSHRYRRNKATLAV